MTKALYRSVVEIDNTALIEAFGRRVDAAITAMLASASARFTDLATVNLTLVTVNFGTVRTAFERGLPPTTDDAVQRELIAMCRSYPKTAARQ